jgi:hypothetical protein
MIENSVSIFLGNFQSALELDNYTREIYSNDGDVTSQFMQSFKIDFIDNQFQEVLFLDTNNSIENLVSPLSYSESFIQKLNFTGHANAVIALYNYIYNGVVRSDEHMNFAGVYKFDPE